MTSSMFAIVEPPSGVRTRRGLGIDSDTNSRGGSSSTARSTATAASRSRSARRATPAASSNRPTSHLATRATGDDAHTVRDTCHGSNQRDTNGGITDAPRADAESLAELLGAPRRQHGGTDDGRRVSVPKESVRPRRRAATWTPISAGAPLPDSSTGVRPRRMYPYPPCRTSSHIGCISVKRPRNSYAYFRQA